MAIWMRTVKLGVRGAVRPLAEVLARAGVHANWLTLAGALFLLFNALDFLDGAVARAAGTAGAYGAFLDSVLDRYSEAVVFVGLLIWFSGTQELIGLGATALALVGSFMVSYCRARAEGLGLECEVGLLQRPERIVVLGIGLMFSELTHPMVLVAVLIALALLTDLTAVQRMRHVARLFQERAVRR